MRLYERRTLYTASQVADVGSLHEGFPYAMELSKTGYNAFVLRCRVGRGGGIATEDLARAIFIIFVNADALDVDLENYSLWCRSAGARMITYRRDSFWWGQPSQTCGHGYGLYRTFHFHARRPTYVCNRKRKRPDCQCVCRGKKSQ